MPKGQPDEDLSPEEIRLKSEQAAKASLAREAERRALKLKRDSDNLASVMKRRRGVKKELNTVLLQRAVPVVLAPQILAFVGHEAS